jgi:F-box protein 9
MQLVPDIESRTTQQSVSSEASDEESDVEEATAGGEGETALYSKLSQLLDPCAPVCAPSHALNRPAGHISSLPREIFELILLWVVGSDLDLRSLQALSSVCRSFYVLTKSEALFRKACQRVWGPLCSLQGGAPEQQSTYTYTSYRAMFSSRPQPRYNGCYVSKTAIHYIRNANIFTRLLIPR